MQTIDEKIKQARKCGHCQNFKRFTKQEISVLVQIFGEIIKDCGECVNDKGALGEPIIVHRCLPVTDAEVMPHDCDFEWEEEAYEEVSRELSW